MYVCRDMGKTFLIGIMISLLLTACKSNIEYVNKTDRSQPYREVPFKEFRQKKGSDRLAIILPDYPDTVKIEQSALLQMLKKEGYDIIIVAKPGYNKDAILSMDSRQNRIDDVTAVYLTAAHQQYSHHVLIGIGEGAFIVPALRKQLQVDTSIAVNMNPHSPLAAYEQWLIADSLSSYQLQILSTKNILNLTELAGRIEGIKKDINGADRLAPNTNQQWMSYYNNPAYYDVLNSTLPFFWVNFEQCPMISAAHQIEAALYCKIPFAHFYLLPGKGNLNNEEQMKLLVDKLRKIVSY